MKHAGDIYTCPDDTGARWCYGCEKRGYCDKLTDRHSVCELERDAYEAGIAEGLRRAKAQDGSAP